VVAQDAFGNTAIGYRGTVHLTSTDASAALPADHTFTAADNGTFTFQGVTLKDASALQSVTATDTVSPGIAGTLSGIAVTPGPAASLVVSGPGGTIAGSPLSIIVEAHDACLGNRPSGNLATGYLGTVSFRSSDVNATVAANDAFLPADQGRVTVSGFVLRTAGLRSITATDIADSSLTGTSPPILVSPASAASLAASGFPAAVTAGVAGAITVSAMDAFGNAATTYAGTVSFSSTDGQAVLPPPTTFTATDAGSRPFAVTLKTAGTQSIQVTDGTTAPCQAGTFSACQTGIVVSPAAAARFIVSGVPSPIASGIAASVVVEARDAFANRATGYLGTVSFSSSDPQAALPAPYAFTASDAGLHTFPNAVTLFSPGSQSITAGDGTISGTQPGIVVTDSVPPTWPAGSRLTVAVTSSTTAHLTWTPATDNVGVTSYLLYRNGVLDQTLSGSALAADVGGLTVGTPTGFQVQARDAAGNSTTNGPTTSVTTVPPSPQVVAPPLDTTTATTIAAATSFLYSGADAIQTGVAAGTITDTRAAVLRGLVRDRASQPLSGVRISVRNHPEYGLTWSRLDGRYDLAVNGGDRLTIDYDRADLMAVQRQVTPSWQDFTPMPDVVMVPPDQSVSLIAGGAATTQVARGSVSIDDIGSRQATVVFPPGTSATITLPDGSTQTLSTMHIRATEVTVGADGPRAMPGPLPSTSAYTYAVNFTADEAVQAGASHVQFSQPVFGYVENFLAMPVGSIVPNGTYDPPTGRWLPEGNGQVISIVSVTGGAADIDSNGDGVADDATTLAVLGFTNAERVQLAALYQPGQSLWRSPIVHFSWLDWNYPIGFPLNPQKPNPPPPDKPDPLPNPCEMNSCIIEVENQVLGERIPLIGTGYELDYSSAVVAGRRANYRLNLQVPAPFLQPLPPNIIVCRPNRTPECRSEGAVPTPYRVDSTVSVSVAGREFKTTSESAAIGVDTTWFFEWDGRDGYGRGMQGEQPATVRTCYNYPAILYGDEAPFFSSWAQPALSGVSRVARFVGQSSAVFDLCAEANVKIGGWNVKPAALGGWTLSAQHMLDVPNQTVYRGDRGIQRVDDLNRYVVNAAVGSGTSASPDHPVPLPDGARANTIDLGPITGLSVGPEGSIYFSDSQRSVIGRVTPDGIFHVYAGQQVGTGSDAEGVVATAAALHVPTGLALASDGTLYYSDSNSGRIRKITPDGHVFTVAGNGLIGGFGFTADGADALSAQLGLRGRSTIAVSSDGTVYFPEPSNHRIRKVGPDRILRTAAGSGPAGPNLETFGSFSGDGGPALQARMNSPNGAALGPDGSLYIADSCNQRVRKVTPDGIITTIAGIGGDCRSDNPRTGGDGGPATSAGIGYPLFALGVAPDSTVFIGAYALARVRRINPFGTIDTVAGNGFIGGPNSGVPGCVGDNCPGPATPVGSVQSLALGPAGEIYTSQGNGLQLIVRLSSASAKLNLSLTDILVPSPDAREVYVFDSRGRHQRTLDALTNAALQSFAYDSAGRLVSITNRDANVTQIQRDAQGNPTSIAGPFGQQTSLALDSDGYLHTATNPNGEMVQLFYKPVVAGDPHTGGLLSQYTDARGGSAFYEYDADGFLTKDTRADASWHSFSRGGRLSAQGVTRTTALGRRETYAASRTTNGDEETRIVTDMAGLRAVQTRKGDHSTTQTLPNGTVIATAELPDPRFGIQASIKSTTSKTPSGLTRTESRSRTANLSNPNDPLSLTSLIEQVTVNGRTSRSTYDASARTITQVTPMGRQTVTTLDAHGRVTQIQPPGTVATTIGYDANGRPQTVAQGSRVTTTSYRPDGFVGSIVDPLLNTTSFEYDLAGRTIRTTLPNSAIVEMSYDSTGNVTSLTPPGRAAHLFAYTPANQESDYIPPELGQPRTTHTAYNLDQQVATISRPDGDFITPTYDTATGRLTALSTSRGTITYSYSSSTGQLTSVNTFDGVGLTYAYDGSLLGDVTWSGAVSGNVHRTYDSSFRVATESVTGGQPINFAHDNDDLLTSAGALNITRDPATGFITSTTLGVVRETYTYDVYGDVQAQAVATNGAILYSADYGTRDALGRIVTKTETVQGEAHSYGYMYDVTGRLTDVTKDGVATSHYEYDANGNRTVGPGLSVSPVYDAQDRLLSYGECTYVYKADGSLQTKTCPDGTAVYDHDAFGNLRGVALPNGTSITYIIDGQSRRVGKKVNGLLVESFLYEDDLKRLAWYDGGGSLKAQFIFGSRRHVPDYMIKSGVNYKFVSDQVGSVRQIVAPDGSIAQNITYDEFGNVLADSAPGFQPFGFGGGLVDVDTKLVRFGARDYAPPLGRWITRDPIGFHGGDSNLYAYINSDPVNDYDEDGLARTPKTCAEAFTLARNTLNEIIKTIRDAVRFHGCQLDPGHLFKIAQLQSRLKDLIKQIYKRCGTFSEAQLVSLAELEWWAQVNIDSLNTFLREACIKCFTTPSGPLGFPR